MVVDTPTASNSDLGGTSIAAPNFDFDLYWVDEPANGGSPNHIYDNDLSDTAGGVDDTTGQPGEGVADSDGGPVVGMAEIGVFRGATVELASGDTVEVDIYAFRLEDGRTVLRVDDNVMGGVRSAGIQPSDVTSVTLPTDYEQLTSIDSTEFDKNFQLICFADGTLIETADGPVAVEDLRPGMMIRTADHGYRPLRLALHRTIGSALQMQNDRMRPVRISAGALGDGLPLRDLRVSRQHRVLVSSQICQRMFGTREVLVPAIRLTDLPGVFVEDSLEEVTFYHLVLDRHEVLFAEGVAAESLFLGEGALDGLTEEAREELLTLFPNALEDAACAVPARPVPAGGRIRRLIARHGKAQMPLVSTRH
ncbi:Hint domain-containing protein [Paracoccus spongiarum]|uniref:Hint domain-containing protein n=1 Tax=Paracoccus spongiarum TaxID=3064387 RepID=A0ABT9JFN4_9RHOB|nr:Hint domain-containing protein [Paracoccus sp. 2205BS29-5]MDP5308510.1 Hint domain-containing protein [Paracoccus sp. 2205BS29-5]